MRKHNKGISVSLEIDLMQKWKPARKPRNNNWKTRSFGNTKAKIGTCFKKI